MPDGVTLVLYDLTSTYFEGKSLVKIGKYGYSRAVCCSEREQVILAVATDSSGVLIHMKVLKGNRTPIILPSNHCWKIWKAGLAQRKQPLYLMGGSSLDLEQMTKEGMDYVTLLSSSALQALIKDLPHDNQHELWDRDQLMEFEVRCHWTEIPAEWLVCAFYFYFHPNSSKRRFF